ncbi:hypothetical protein BKA69DRAFT_895839 [Paraphysoderma sedebokerense]|nr:hypothetical protein BKA69DRAFT_895839 [Paraphysoderma sedebokerense]
MQTNTIFRIVTKFFIGVVLFGRLLAYDNIPFLPTPWYLNTSASVNLQAGTTIIDTHSLKPPDYCVLTGRNGSNVVGLYRYKVEYTGWIGLNTTLGGVGWAFDIQRKWSTAAITVNPWTRILYIVYLYSNMLVFRQYPMIDTLFDSNSATGTAFQFTLARVVPRPFVSSFRVLNVVELLIFTVLCFQSLDNSFYTGRIIPLFLLVFIRILNWMWDFNLISSSASSM